MFFKGRVNNINYLQKRKRSCNTFIKMLKMLVQLMNTYRCSTQQVHRTYMFSTNKTESMSCNKNKQKQTSDTTLNTGSKHTLQLLTANYSWSGHRGRSLSHTHTHPRTHTWCVTVILTLMFETWSNFRASNEWRPEPQTFSPAARPVGHVTSCAIRLATRHFTQMQIYCGVVHHPPVM